MKTQVIVSSTLAMAFTALGLLIAAGGAEGCSGGSDTNKGGGGESATSSSSAGGAGGAGGAPVDAGPNPLEASCSSICDHLKTIANCTAWQQCSTECQNGFNAPSACQDEVKALIDCWAANLDTFNCEMTQLVPPAACQDLETKFNDCFSGTGMMNSTFDTACPGQTKNGGASNCAAKSPCTDGVTEYKSTCQLPAGSSDWTCACYKGTTLLGTCTDQMATVCDNHMGCCKPFFFLSMQ